MDLTEQERETLLLEGAFWEHLRRTDRVLSKITASQDAVECLRLENLLEPILGLQQRTAMLMGGVDQTDGVMFLEACRVFANMLAAIAARGAMTDSERRVFAEAVSCFRRARLC
jgi:hypothetical protein